MGTQPRLERIVQVPSEGDTRVFRDQHGQLIENPCELDKRFTGKAMRLHMYSELAKEVAKREGVWEVPGRKLYEYEETPISGTDKKVYQIQFYERPVSKD